MGIVETRGNVKDVTEPAGAERKNGLSLRIEPIDSGFMTNDIIIGSSIAVNGTCLTVTSRDMNSFTVDLAPETLQKTSFAQIRSGDEANLERAMKVGDRNSGHTLQGHVDGTGVITALAQDGLSLRVKISTSGISSDKRTREYMNSLIVPKGFIGLDGASLTICEVNREEEWFTLMLIPHTVSVLKKWELNAKVNIELDCMAKYIASAVETFVSPLQSQIMARNRTLEVITAVAFFTSLISVIIAVRR